MTGGTITIAMRVDDLSIYMQAREHVYKDILGNKHHALQRQSACMVDLEQLLMHAGS